jgi:spore maturation protein CgeB
MPPHNPLRILAVSVLHQGANDYAFVRAFRRAGHSVSVVPADTYIPNWENVALRALRRAMTPLFVADYNKALMRMAKQMRPHLFFVFKGQYVTPETMAAIKAMGAITIQFYPDTGFADHGPYIPKAISLYDWVFTTKPAGIVDLRKNYHQSNASFIPHAFDPETHAPAPLKNDDTEIYQCDASFIGDISTKKLAQIKRVVQKLPEIKMKIWGAQKWGSIPDLESSYQGTGVWGTEYSKAIGGSKINIGALFEGGPSAPEGDLITARTFEIPAAGGFMLHERTDEAMTYFEDGKECAFYSDPDDLIAKIRYYLSHGAERKAIAKAGRARCLSSGYSVDDRVKTVLDKYYELRENFMSEKVPM